MKWLVQHKKRILYTLCFMALNGIDFVKNTQTGDLWRTAVNLTGLVMMIFIGSKINVKKLVNPISIIWTIVTFAVTGWAVHVGGGAIFHMYYLAFAAAVLNVWWIPIFICYFIKNSRNVKLISGKMELLVLITAALMIISKSGRDWPLWFLLMFWMFYHTDYSKEDKNDLFMGMIDGNIISFFCIQIFAYGFRPYDVIRYQGGFNNCNITALHYLVVYVMLLIKLHQLHMNKCKAWVKAFFYVGAAGMVCFQFLTMGRTAWFTTIVITIMYGLLVMRSIWKKSFIKLILHGLALLMTVVILFPVVFATVRYLPTVMHHPIWFEGEYSVDKVHSFDPANSEKYIEMDEFLSAVFGRIFSTFQRSKEAYAPANYGLMVKMLPVSTPSINFVKTNFFPSALDEEVKEKEGIPLMGQEGIDESLRVRLTIFKTYMSELNVLGHNEYEGHYTILNQDGWPLCKMWHAQNFTLQMMYSYGVLPGVLIMIISVWLIWKSVKKMKTDAQNPMSIAPLFVFSTFYIYGLMEMVWNLGQLIFFMVFFVAIGLKHEE